MKRSLLRMLALVALAASAAGCDAFRSLTHSAQNAQGKPYELIVVCGQEGWTGPLGDSLRSVFTAPVPYLNQTEPRFDVQRVTPRGFTRLVVNHRNILKTLVDPELAEAAAAVQRDLTARPQLVVTLQGPSNAALAAYVGAHADELLQVFESAERDRAVEFNRSFGDAKVAAAIEQRFGVKMAVPQGYLLAANEPDFIWARFEYPTASQGFFIYSYPYEGPQSLSAEALLAARNRFAARIPGPSDGSYMTTSTVFEPDYRMFRLEGRLWCEMRGFWDVEGDFMGGPYVSFTTVDTERNRVFTLDGYVYAPDLKKPRKRNYVRGIEHLFYGIGFPAAE